MFLGSECHLHQDARVGADAVWYSSTAVGNLRASKGAGAVIRLARDYKRQLRRQLKTKSGSAAYLCPRPGNLSLPS